MTQRSEKPGIILAAGLGTRLNGLEMKPRVKPFAPIDGTPLLIRTIRNLEIAGSRDIVVVLGWQAQIFAEQVGLHYEGPARIQYIFNRHYELQNGVSVLCAKPFVKKEFILTMADHVFDEEVLHLVRRHQPPDGGATLCVDYKLDSIFDMEDATKVLEKDGHVQAIGKSLTTYNCIDTGIFIGTDGLMDAIEKIYDQNGDASLSKGVERLAQTGRMETLDIKGAFWQDVDTPEMLAHAETLLRKHSKN